MVKVVKVMVLGKCTSCFKRQRCCTRCRRKIALIHRFGALCLLQEQLRVVRPHQTPSTVLYVRAGDGGGEGMEAHVFFLVFFRVYLPS